MSSHHCHLKKVRAAHDSIVKRLICLCPTNAINMNELTQNELFITILAKSVRAAIETHQKEKCDKLRNAVINTALKMELKEDLQIIFLDNISQLSLSHLKLLSLFYVNEKKFSNVSSYEELYSLCINEDEIYSEVDKA